MKHLLLLAFIFLPIIAQADVQESSYEIDAERVVLSHQESSRTDIVVVTKSGDLTVNGAWITTEKGDRKLLRKAFQEFVKLDRMQKEFTADMELVVSKAAEGADPQSTADQEAKISKAARTLEGRAKDLEKQAGKVTKLGLELKGQIPALADFHWALDN